MSILTHGEPPGLRGWRDDVGDCPKAGLFALDADQKTTIRAGT
ncbi:hypothetical protein DW66_2593 [Pseudomonas putida]|nr:hypothetical protein DW66_2593 [Pseudomonas putida]AJG13991.1 hypothetical protein RK21_02483 [Pseudomonas plecoglossicida]